MSRQAHIINYTAATTRAELLNKIRDIMAATFTGGVVFDDIAGSEYFIAETDTGAVKNGFADERMFVKVSLEVNQLTITPSHSLNAGGDDIVNDVSETQKRAQVEVVFGESGVIFMCSDDRFMWLALKTSAGLSDVIGSTGSDRQEGDAEDLGTAGVNGVVLEYSRVVRFSVSNTSGGRTSLCVVRPFFSNSGNVVSSTNHAQALKPPVWYGEADSTAKYHTTEFSGTPLLADGEVQIMPSYFSFFGSVNHAKDSAVQTDFSLSSLACSKYIHSQIVDESVLPATGPAEYIVLYALALEWAPHVSSTIGS